MASIQFRSELNPSPVPVLDPIQIFMNMAESKTDEGGGGDFDSMWGVTLPNAMGDYLNKRTRGRRGTRTSLICQYIHQIRAYPYLGFVSSGGARIGLGVEEPPHDGGEEVYPLQEMTLPSL
ncbi:hypothetical protein VNO77_19176 [Canavalia gladiata]|uniref:Uncharacterized protein n=1 Tax=Canavalia gladiata TaxID=3824 RepID=A0AAN9LM69_CANGL